MRYGSVCSGIEAATAAWHPLGWEPAFFSEIEPFPRAVLAHHYPDVPLHGDFTTIKEDEYGAIDLLVGGTPCQSFSIAGLRKGMDDDRGNLALEFLRLAQRKRPRWLVWENVPGVLSSNRGRDFGSILGGLVELGYGFAYRVLDAQFFGVAQRRRRVFVVGCIGDAARAAAVLFERHSLSGHPSPRRKAGQETPRWPADCAATLDSTFGEKHGQDNQHINSGAPLFVPAISPCLVTQVGGLRQPCTQAYVVTPPITASMKTPLGNGGKDDFIIPTSNAVRRLTPIECERLQGFADDFTRIPWRNKSADQCPDGPRYKALGNSMAVPVMRWIGKRIDEVEKINGQ